MNIGFLGTGKMAKVMASTISQMEKEGIHLYAVASRMLEKAESFQREFQAEKAYGSYAELVHDKNVDLVYIATPHSEHYKNCKLALSQNKNVLLEKAFTTSYNEAKELIEEAEERKVLLAEAIWTRYMPSRKTIQEILDNGMIGNVNYVSANLGYYLLNKERMIDANLAGGSLLDVGIYPLNFACMVFPGKLEHIYAHCTYTENHLDDTDAFTLIFGDGKMADLSCSMSCVTNRKGLIFGTNGYVEVDNINNPSEIRIFDKEHKLRMLLKAPQQISGYEYELREVKRTIENHRIECPSMPHKDILSMMQIYDEIRRQMDIVYPFEKEE